LVSDCVVFHVRSVFAEDCWFALRFSRSLRFEHDGRGQPDVLGGGSPALLFPLILWSSRMARKTINKSQAIRDYLAGNPAATPTVIQQDLQRQGIKVGYSLISQVKYKGGPGRKATRGGARGRGRAPNISIDELVSAKQIADRLGGVDRAKQALTLLERLQ
jgi:hypothetical protein